MQRLRVVAGALCILGALVLAPTLSAAQEDEATEPVTPTETTPAPPPAGEDKTSEQAPEPPAKPTGNALVDGEAPARTSGKAKAKAAAIVNVSMRDNFYTPRNVSITVGDTIIWINNGEVQHSATADNGTFDTGIFGPGQSRSERFRAEGSYPYVCALHPNMRGRVEVAAAAEPVEPVDPGGSSSALPATGFAALGLGAIGLALLASGLLTRRGARYVRPGWRR